MQKELIDVIAVDGVLHVAGEIDVGSAPCLDAALAAGDAEVIDLSAVTFMDSSGLNVLIRHHRRQPENTESLRIVALSSCVHRLLEVTGALRMFTDDHAAGETAADSPPTRDRPTRRDLQPSKPSRDHAGTGCVRDLAGRATGRGELPTVSAVQPVLSRRALTVAPVTPQPYDGPATVPVDGDVYRIPYLRLEQQESMLFGRSGERPVVIVPERGELPKDRTHTGDLRLGDRQELIAWWTGFGFEL